MNQLISKRLKESIEVKQRIIEDEDLLNEIDQLAICIIECFQNGGKILLCGNGGSASDALHMAGELVGRFQVERKPLPAIVLNADVATITSISNDYSYDKVFVRQVEAYIKSEDIILGISTSGNSNNVYSALEVAKKVGAKTAALLGKDGGIIKDIVDYPIVVPDKVTARIQESHITIIHIICELIDRYYVQEMAEDETSK